MEKVWEIMAEIRNALMEFPYPDDTLRSSRIVRDWLKENSDSGIWENHHMHVSVLRGAAENMIRSHKEFGRLINQLSDELHKLSTPE